MSQIAPSLLAADFTRLDRELEKARDAGVKVLHLDVMDGHFVPNITFGASLVKALRPLGEGMLFDVHLMMTHPLVYIDRFASAGADMITIHVECKDDIDSCLDLIRSFGKTVGISIKPQTPVADILPYFDKLDMVLVMTVEPGFGAQTMKYECLKKIAEIRAEAARRGREITVSVDGGVKPENCAMVAGMGADILVAGSAVFGAEDMPAAFEKMDTLIRMVR